MMENERPFGHGFAVRAGEGQPPLCRCFDEALEGLRNELVVSSSRLGTTLLLPSSLPDAAASVVGY